MLYSPVCEEYFSVLHLCDGRAFERMHAAMVSIELKFLEAAASSYGFPAQQTSLLAERIISQVQGVVTTAALFETDLIIASSTQRCSPVRWGLTY